MDVSGRVDAVWEIAFDDSPDILRGPFTELRDICVTGQTRTRDQQALTY